MWLTEDFDADMEELLAEKNHYTLLELCKCPIFAEERALLSEEVVEEGLPQIKPRYYSIANDPFYTESTS